MDYTDKFVVIGRNDEGQIITVVDVVGGNYGEIEKAALETAEKTKLKYEIIHDQTLFDVVYHFETQYQFILDNMRALYNNTFMLNKAVIDDEETSQTEETTEASVEETTEEKEKE
jgi:hypothetical protein